MGQLSSLFYKNWLLFKRNLLGSVCEMLIPVIFIFFFLLVSKLDPPIDFKEQSFIGNSTYDKTINSFDAATLKYPPFKPEIALASQLV